MQETTPWERVYGVQGGLHCVRTLGLNYRQGIKWKSRVIVAPFHLVFDDATVMIPIKLTTMMLDLLAVESSPAGALIDEQKGFRQGEPEAQSKPQHQKSFTDGGAGYRSRYLSHAKRALYHLSYAPCILNNPDQALLQKTNA